MAEKCLPFFNLLKGAKNKKDIDWAPECQQAFEVIKAHLAQPHILSKANPGEPLYLYLSAGPLAVGAALIREESGIQKPIYYVNQVLKDAELRYPNLEKFAFSLVMTSRKLRHYFQGREIRVITDQPLRKIINKPDASRRLINWAVELSQFNLVFLPRTSIKAQALVDFIVECTFPEAAPVPQSKQDNPHSLSPDQEKWEVYVDGSSTNERSGSDLILCSPGGFNIQQAITFLFPATNNQVEYEALLVGLRLANTLNLKVLRIYSDSQIMVKQIKGEYIAKDPQLAQYQALVQTYLSQLAEVDLVQINREDNIRVDALSKLVQNSADLDSSVYFEELKAPSFTIAEVMCLDTLPD